MPDPLRNRTAGEKLPRDVATWNALLSAARESREAKREVARLAATFRDDLQLINTSESVDYAQFALVAVGDAVGANADVYKAQDVFEIVPVSAAGYRAQTLAVLQLAAPKGARNVVPGRVLGTTTIRLAPADASGRYLRPSEDTTKCEQTDERTSMELLHVHADGQFGKAILLGNGREVVKFLLLTNLALGGQADAVIIEWDAGAGEFVAIGDPVVVSAAIVPGVFGPAPGLVDSGAGATGWAQYNADRDVFEVVFMERFALCVHATTTSVFSGGQATADVTYRWHGMPPLAAPIVVSLPPCHLYKAHLFPEGTQVIGVYDERADNYQIVEVDTALKVGAVATCPRDEQGNPAGGEFSAAYVATLLFGTGLTVYTPETLPALPPGVALIESLSGIEICNLDYCPGEQTQPCGPGVKVTRLMGGLGITFADSVGDDCERAATIHGGLDVFNVSAQNEPVQLGTVAGLIFDHCLEVVASQIPCVGLVRLKHQPSQDDTERKVITGIRCDSDGRVVEVCYQTETWNACGLRTSVSEEVCAPCCAMVAGFSGEPLDGSDPLTVQFTDTSTGQPTAWSWEKSSDGGATWIPFGQYPTQQNPEETFHEGSWWIRLTASKVGCSDSETKAGYVHVDPPPDPFIADFTYDPAQGNCGLTVTFTDTTVGQPTAWSWEKSSDGGANWIPFAMSPNSQSPAETFATGLTWSIRLTASKAGASDSETKLDIISVTPVVAGFTANAPTSGYCGFSATFTDTSTGQPTAWSWEKSSDGGANWIPFAMSPNSQSPAETFATGALWSIRLTASNDCSSDAETKLDIIAITPVVANFTTNAPASGTEPLNVTFTDTSTGQPTAWSWEKSSDGGANWIPFAMSPNSQSPAETFAAGTWAIRLTASNACSSDSETKTGQVSATAYDPAIGDESAWYAPSLDDAGNGTLTLNAEVGGSNGALTNMETGDWIADTTAGGVRAIQLGGTDESIATGATRAFGTSDKSFAVWLRIDTEGDDDWFANRPTGALGTVAGWYIGKGGDSTAGRMQILLDATGGNYVAQRFDSFIPGGWFHLLFTWKNSTGELKVYKNGSLVAASADTSSGTPAGQSYGAAANFQIGGRPGNSTRYPAMTFDDLRFFDRVVTAGEIATLAGGRAH